MPAIIRQLGVDPASIFADVGLPADCFDTPEQRIPYAAMGALFQEAARRTGCAHFGLLCGRVWHISDLGIVGELVRNSPSVGSALQTLTVYQHINSEGGLAFFLQRDSVVDLGYAIYQPALSGASEIYDTLLAGGCNFLRELCGVDWTPSEVFFSHSRPSDLNPYQRFFRASLRFDSEFCALRFPVHWLNRPVPGADPGRLRIAEREAQASGHGQLIQQVSRALRVMLLYGNSSGDDVAQMLAMHRRTLNRRLKANDVTFQAVLDEVRFAVAQQLLADTQLGIDDIAAALGYASVSPFMRSFQRWSGTTPGRWRQAAQMRRPVVRGAR